MTVANKQKENTSETTAEGAMEVKGAMEAKVATAPTAIDEAELIVANTARFTAQLVLQPLLRELGE